MSQTARFHMVQDRGMPSDTGTTRIPHGRDRAARRLFGHPEVVADLLRGFMPEGPIREFDPDSLSQGPDDRMDERLALYQSDVTWSLTLADGARVVLIIEGEGWSGAARREAWFAKPERDDRMSSLGHQRSNSAAAGCHQMPAKGQPWPCGWRYRR